ncbi:MAG: SAM-dependent methyltransferase, partial [Actinobacteria bacterium]
PDMLLTAGILRNELVGLDFDHLVECNRSVVEGIGHTGDAAVVQVVAHRAADAST